MHIRPSLGGLHKHDWFRNFGVRSQRSYAPRFIIMAGLWSMPGLIAYVDLYNFGISILALVIAKGIVNVRVLPLTIATVPVIKR
jgi:hypothetical protein